MAVSLSLPSLHVSACWLSLLNLRPPFFFFQEKLLAHSKLTFPKFSFFQRRIEAVSGLKVWEPTCPLLQSCPGISNDCLRNAEYHPMALWAQFLFCKSVSKECVWLKVIENDDIKNVYLFFSHNKKSGRMWFGIGSMVLKVLVQWHLMPQVLCLSASPSLECWLSCLYLLLHDHRMAATTLTITSTIKVGIRGKPFLTLIIRDTKVYQKPPSWLLLSSPWPWWCHMTESNSQGCWENESLVFSLENSGG